MFYWVFLILSSKGSVSKLHILVRVDRKVLVLSTALITFSLYVYIRVCVRCVCCVCVQLCVVCGVCAVCVRRVCVMCVCGVRGVCMR